MGVADGMLSMGSVFSSDESLLCCLIDVVVKVVVLEYVISSHIAIRLFVDALLCFVLLPCRYILFRLSLICVSIGAILSFLGTSL